MHLFGRIACSLARRRSWRHLVLAVTLVAALSATMGCGDSSADVVTTPAVLATAPAPNVQAPSGILVDRASGRVLWSKAPHSRRPPASLTKVMTAIIVLERVRDLSSWCTVPRAVDQKLGNVVGLRPGDRITVRQALRATLVKSANDACLTLACRVSGSETDFVRLMNAKARRLGLDDTHFTNSYGKPMKGHYMSADDLARLGRYVMRNAQFREFCGTQTATIRWPGHAVPVESHNPLLGYDWADGIKTGATAESGKCLLGSGTYGLRALVVVTLHEPSRDQEEKDAVALFRWGDAQYEERLIIGAGDMVTTVPLAGGGAVRAVARSELTRVVRRAAELRTSVSLLSSTLEAIPEPGTRLGAVTYRADGLRLGTIELVADGRFTPSPRPTAR